MRSPAPENQAAAPAATTSPQEEAGARRWDLQSSGEGTALALLAAGDRTEIRLFCPANAASLVVNVPSFRPIGSEERLSFGSGGNVTALVADVRGDRERGGVTGTAPVPADLPALIGGTLSASYGAQRTGPLPAPPARLAAAFQTACMERAAAQVGPARRAGACRVQDGEILDNPPLRAVGTEPFWGARIEGRCVTYLHPEDQTGTRVWARYAPSPDGATWTGALNGQPFVLRARAAPGCSDGMSDERYPIAVSLTVNGEQRTGCARPG